MDDVEEYSKNIKKQADKILISTNLVEILSQYGKVQIGGAYDLDLMYDPDIDIRVFCENPRLASVKVLSALIEYRQFQKYQYGDFEKFERKNRPKSHIVVLILPFEELLWEIEIWFHKHENNTTEPLLEKMKNEMTDLQKTEILKAKEKRAKSGNSKHNLSSVEIYKEVMNWQNLK